MKTANTHASLFSGIGGFDLAAEWMGYKNLFHCEWNPFTQKVLNYYWPEAKTYEDITKTDFTIWAGQVDILTGGFPCQPYSSAGKRLGTEDNRHLWPEMLRAIREIHPAYVVAENVSGLISWNKGLVFHEVQTDLEAQGYTVQPVVLPACSVGAPHRRDRVWFVATNPHYHRKSGESREYEGKGKGKRLQKRNTVQQPKKPNPLRQKNRNSISYTYIGSKRPSRKSREIKSLRSHHLILQKRRRKQAKLHPRCSHVFRAYSHTKRIRQQEQGQPIRPMHKKTHKEWKASWAYHDGRWPTQPPLCSRNDGLPARLARITLSKHRKESIKAYGNAIVPQVALQIFKALNPKKHDTVFNHK